VKNEQKPEVRFPEFKDDWQNYKLGELYTERKEKGKDSLPILSVSIHKGVSDKELDTDDLGKSVLRSEDKSIYKHVYPGDLVLNMMRAWQGAFGVVKLEGMVSPAYITATPSKDIFPPFMDYCLHRNEMIAQINNFSYGVTDFRKRLYWKSFINVLCHIPSVLEQQKITSFFTKLDKSISIHQQELTTLRQTKQGFLQKMFPKEGESVPEVRFPGFDRDWVRCKLGDVGTVKSGIGFPDSEQGGREGIPFYKVSDMNTRGNENEMLNSNNYVTNEQIKTRNWLPIEDVPSVIFAKVGAALMLNRKRLIRKPFLIDNNLMAFSFSEDWDIDFGYILFQSLFFPKYAQVGALPSFNASDINSIEIKMPIKEEQIKIGTFFKQLDETISLHQRELEILKETKKTFLQKMFV
jgi:type I restriction enzyme, S subunit